MRDEKRFWDRFSHIYTKFVSDSDRTYDEAAALIAPYIEPGMRVLELACGTGQFTLRLASLACEWYATDFSAAMLGRAARRARSRGAAFGVADAYNLALPDASFDAVLIGNALHIMPLAERAAASIRRVLKPGGLLFAPTFVRSGVPANAAHIRFIRALGLRVYNNFDAASLREWLAGQGFELIESEIAGGERKPMCCAIARLR